MKKTTFRALRLVIAVVAAFGAPNCFSDEPTAALTQETSANASNESPVTIYLEPECDPNDRLLDVIKKEATVSEVFPFAYLFTWDLCAQRYDLTFERYLSFYRFKQKAAQATPEEIDECVRALDRLNNKEKAFVLTAIFIFEHTRRPRNLDSPSLDLKNAPLAGGVLVDAIDGSQNDVSPDAEEDYRCFYWYLHLNADNPRRIKIAVRKDDFSKFVRERERAGQYVPDYYYNPEFKGNFISLLFPPYAPDEQIEASSWRRWRDAIAKYADVNDVAIEAFRPDDMPRLKFPFNTATRENAYNFGKTAVDWYRNLDLCKELIRQNLGFDVSDEDSLAVLGLKTLDNKNSDSAASSFMEEFLKRTKTLEEQNGKQAPIMKALREYWFVIHLAPASQWLSQGFGQSSAGPLVWAGNGSAWDVTLRDVSVALMSNRLPYTGDPQFTAPPKKLTEEEKRIEERKEEWGLTP